MSERMADFFIIGAMKCGTSTLHQQLAERSGLYLSDPKEPNFFSDDRKVARDLDWYTGLFRGARDEQLCGESSTHYTKLPTYPNTVDNLARFVKEPKFIYVMRDPIVRIVSQYIHEWTQREVRGSLEAAVLGHERYVAYSSYARQLRPYLQRFGSHRILLVFFERMIEQPEAELQRVCSFLEDPSPEPVVWSESVGRENVSQVRMKKSVLRDALLRVGLFRSLKDRLPEPVKDHVKSLWQMRRRPDLSSALRSELESQLDPDLAVLGSWLGVSLSSRTWKAQAHARAADWVAPPPNFSTPAPAELA